MITKTVSVNRWGNGLGIRLPKEFIDKAGITETSRVEVSEVDGQLVIVRAKEARKHIPLAERRKMFKAQNPDWDGKPYELLPEDEEWLNMEPVGEEWGANDE